ncbi:glycosyltransferase family 2 protein [Thioclava nitratireducens]|uniref:glycosyltransferase family 2 protein n=1 Tax=Thioclava nitratireducens TaxID=1915078 RepID=UPI002480EBD1|nr:glycosyltransferase family 2 protein [Thioclava nitratireducens]WGT49514.1 glycosyltransferase family 2 protein [Thioclava nitratireducens]
MAEAAIIIPHYNDVSRLMRCLETLSPQLDARCELVVVDNGSTDDLAPVRAAYPDLRIVTEAKKGAAEARNRGVAETTAERLFFIDSDCVADPDWIATAFDVAGQGDLVGGHVFVFEETPPPRSGAEAFETVFAFDFRRYIEEKGFSGTGNLLTRRDVYEATGPFIAGLSEDLDWCRRATAKGYSLVYAERLRVGHPSRQDWAALSRKWRRLTEEGFGVNGASLPARLRWGAKALLMPVSILAHLPKVLRHPELNGATERRRAVGTLARLRLARMGWMLRQAIFGRL